MSHGDVETEAARKIFQCLGTCAGGGTVLQTICFAARGRAGTSVWGPDLATLVSRLHGWLSVLSLPKVLQMKDFAGFYLEEALEQNV